MKCVARDSEQALLLASLGREGLEIERVDELTYRIRFDPSRISTSDLIRQICLLVDVRDLLIEDEPIEEIIKRIYAGAALQEASV